MTNPTPTENERIALLRGYTRGYHKVEGTCWHGPDGFTFSYTDPPDYLHEWEHAGPLLEELKQEFGVILPIGNNPWHQVSLRHRHRQTEHITGDTLTEAISRAWIAWKEEKK